MINMWYENACASALSAQKSCKAPILTPEISLNENDDSYTKEVDIKDAKTTISEYRIKNKDKVVLATLNINSLRNKLSSLDIVSNNIDVMIIEETKLDASFPDGQFIVPGYKQPYRRDRDCNGGGVIVYIREDIPSKKLDSFKLDDIEGQFFELNLRKSKWLMFAAYKPPSCSKSKYLDILEML